MVEILKKIVDKKRESLKKIGYNQGLEIPQNRTLPLNILDLDKEIIICEIKRGSPSEGKMNDILNPVEWAKNYIKAGANVISVLTEMNFFYGSLKDLMEIKSNIKEAIVLRKDFLIEEEEIPISYRAGADMVLLIASILSYEKLKSMKELAESFGMLPLIEVHNQKELEMVLKLNPKLIGINSRDLTTFKIDKNYPIALKSLIPDNIKVIFESGIKNYTDAFFVGNSSFNGLLVGTSIVKSNEIKEKIQELKNGFINGYQNRNDFYTRIFKKIYLDKKIVIKICGITNLEDALLVKENGADIIGFVLAESKREISIEKVKKICKNLGNDILKVGVVVDKNIEEAANLVRQGYLHAIQFHNDMTNSQCITYNICWYKAIRVKTEEDFFKEFYSPIILYDAFSEEYYGGTGKTINKKLLDFAKKNGIRLYLAGGINIDNIEEIVKRYKPLMIDLSSGVEEYAGKKSKEKICSFFKKIKNFKNFI